MPNFSKIIDGEVAVSIPGVILLCAYQPTPKGLAALSKFIGLAKKKGWGGSADTAETILVSELADTGTFTKRAGDLAQDIGRFITASDVQEVLRG